MPVTAFLFHTGSIKSQIYPAPQALLPCFYSILVRLKAETDHSQTTDKDEFLFHTGSIKSVKAIDAYFLEIRFYSILVRLKGYIPDCNKPRGAVSIPYWFD